MYIHKSSKDYKHEIIISCKKSELYFNIMIMECGFYVSIDIKKLDMGVFTMSSWAARKYESIPKIWSIEYKYV